MAHNQHQQKITPLSFLADLLYDVAGGLAVAVGTQCFSAPSQIAPGGVSGIAIIINYLTSISISTLVLVINIPLLLLAWRFLGRRFAAKTIKSTLVMSLMLKLVERTGLFYQGQEMLAALYGGILSGIGLALVFMRSSTTGGTDIVARLIQRRLPNIPVGRLLLVVDGAVLLTAALVYRNVESALYALITIFVSSRVVDSMLYGLDMGKVLMIVTDYEHWEELAGQINEEVGRGCTLLEARGTYSKQEKPVLLCAVRSNQVFEVKQVIYRIDPDAFVIALEAGEVIGEGFKPAGAGHR